MITNDGARYIKRYLAGFVPTIAQSIAFGIGNAAETATGTKLQFEAGRVDITLTSFDFVNNKLIYKAQLPTTFEGTIYEVAIYSSSADTASGEASSKNLVTFDSDSEDWVNGAGELPSYSSGTSRIGINSLRHAPVASATEVAVLNEMALDLSGYSGADKFVFAYNVGNANTSSVRIRFITDSSNYYEFNLGSQTAGYKIVEINKSAATATGSPTWASVTAVQVTTVSGAGGASQVDFDGIRIEDADTVNPDYVMIARESLSTPFAKEEGKIQEIEFALDVNIV